MQCPKCGFQNPEEASACVGCGEALTESSAQPVPQEQPVQPPYNQMPPVQQAVNNESKGFGIASLVLGLVSLIFACWLGYLALPMAVVGLVLGILGLKKAPSAKGMAIAGIVLNSILVVFTLIVIILAGSFLALLGTM